MGINTKLSSLAILLTATQAGAAPIGIEITSLSYSCSFLYISDYQQIGTT